MRIAVRLLIVFVMTLLLAERAVAASFIVPTDRELVENSNLIIIATNQGSHAIRTPEGVIDTVFEFTVDEVIKGEISTNSLFKLVEGGGALGGRIEMVPESPNYKVGERALIFVGTNRRGEYCTYGMILGKFNFTRDLNGKRLLIRGADEGEIFGWDAVGNRHVEPMRSEEGFVAFVRAAVCGLSVSESYLVQTANLPPHSLRTKPAVNGSGFHARDYQDIAVAAGGCETGCGLRWKDIFDFPSGSGVVTFQVTGTQSGIADGLGGIDRAMAAWNSDPKSNVTYIRGASGPGVIHLDDSADVPPGFVGYTRYGAGGTYTFDGGLMAATSNVDIAIKANFTSNQTLFDEVMTHELGHSLSFRHSGDGAPSTTQAVMNASSSGSFGASLAGWDTDAVRTVYNLNPDGLVCNAPAISTQPASQSISLGTQATLTVGATGTGPLTYQWYVGNAGTTATPTGTNSPNFNPSPTSTTSYWVRVSNSCNGVQKSDSNTAVVTVTCNAPSAPAPIASPTSIAAGQSSTLSESPTGSGPFTYQWYSGNSGQTGNPIGGATSNNSISVSPSATTSYWVRVTGQCAPPADSPATTVTVNPCVPPAASTPFASPGSINTGQSSTISVSASGTGPFTYQWYSGNSGVTTSPIGGSTSNNFITVSPTADTKYWVRVTGFCAPPSDSAAVTVTVTCSAISSQGVTAQPSTITNGNSSFLSFNTVGSGPFSIQWYTGNVGDTSRPIPGANSTSTIVSPTSNTIYWVRVTAPCGTQDASTIVFVLGTQCTPASITTQPASSTIVSGTPVTLTVVAAGTAPLTYQWYIGDKGDTSNLISGATSASLTRSPTATTKFWVRVSGCNSSTADSNTATITVPTCTAPSITTQPANVSAPIGTAATLNVVAAGTAALHYQWYEGAKGNTTKTVGTDSPTFTTGAINSTIQYWVRVTGQCGTPADSNTATITATAPPRGYAARH